MQRFSRKSSIITVNRSVETDSYYALDNTRQKFDLITMERGEDRHDCRLNVLRLIEPWSHDGGRLVVYPVEIGALGNVGELEVNSFGEPVETWLGRRGNSGRRPQTRGSSIPA